MCPFVPSYRASISPAPTAGNITKEDQSLAVTTTNRLPTPIDVAGLKKML